MSSNGEDIIRETFEKLGAAIGVQMQMPDAMIANLGVSLQAQIDLLAELQSTGRLIPAGGHVLTAEEWANRITLADKQVAVSEAWEQGFEYGSGHKYGAEDDGVRLTAEQVEDVRALVWLDGRRNFDAFYRLRALFPATEPAEEVLDIGSADAEQVSGNLSEIPVSSPTVDEGRESGGQMDRYTCIPAPAEPAEEETKAEVWDAGFEAGYDHAGCEHTPSGISIDPPLNPYDERTAPASSPVVPAPTETEWQRIEDVPESVYLIKDCEGDKWRRDRKSWEVYSERGFRWHPGFPDRFAPFVAAAEEG